MSANVTVTNNRGSTVSKYRTCDRDTTMDGYQITIILVTAFI